MFNILRVSWPSDAAHHVIGTNATVEIRLDDLRVLRRLREAYTRGGFATQVSKLVFVIDDAEQVGSAPSNGSAKVTTVKPLCNAPIRAGKFCARPLCHKGKCK